MSLALMAGSKPALPKWHVSGTAQVVTMGISKCLCKEGKIGACLFLNEVSLFQKPISVSAVGRTSGNGFKLQLKVGTRETLQASRVVGSKRDYFRG